MRIGIASFTTTGRILRKRLMEGNLQHSFIVFDKGKVSCREWVQQNFQHCDAFVFIGATGIAVRLMAPHVTAKDVDPAVVVIDECGQFVIPLLSGHIGGANALAHELATFLEAQAVITTATDIHNVFAVDVWSKEHGCTIAEVGTIKHVSSRLLEGLPVGFYSDFPIEGSIPAGLTLVSQGVKAPYSVEGSSLLGQETCGEGNNQNDCFLTNKGQNPLHSCAQPVAKAYPVFKAYPVGICVSLCSRKQPFSTTLHSIPQIIVVGAGCRKNTSFAAFEAFVLEVLAEHDMSPLALQALASIDLKQNEECFTVFSHTYGIPLRTFTAESLKAIPGSFTGSAFVEGVTGVDNVCERAALAAGGGEIFRSKTSKNGMTVALALCPWVCQF